MPFLALEISIELIEMLREPLVRVRVHDADLATQMRRAATSVPLNLAEGRRRVGRDRLHLWRVAAGSAAEVHTALRVAVAFGYVERERVGEALALLDRLLGMLWSMPRDGAARARA